MKHQSRRTEEQQQISRFTTLLCFSLASLGLGLKACCHHAWSVYYSLHKEEEDSETHRCMHFCVKIWTSFYRKEVETGCLKRPSGKSVQKKKKGWDEGGSRDVDGATLSWVYFLHRFGALYWYLTVPLLLIKINQLECGWDLKKKQTLIRLVVLQLSKPRWIRWGGEK